MGQYLSPPIPSQYQTKCAIVLYPADNGAFYLQAIRGQLSELARPWIWEGDIEKKKEIAAIWLEHDMMTDDTFFALDCEDVPFVTGEEALNVTVNSNCNCGGCCGSGSLGDVNVTINNNPISQPYGPPPDGSDELTDVDGNPTGPIADTYPDKETYDAAACALANDIYDDVYVFVQRLEIGLDTLFLFADLIQFFLGLNVGKAVAEKIGNDWVADLARELRDYVVKDIGTDLLAGGARAWLEANKQTVVCNLYANRQSIPAMRDSALNDILLAWLDACGNQSYTTEETNVIADWVNRIFSIWLVPNKLFGLLTGEYVGDDITPDVDCELCAQPGYAWRVPTTIVEDVDSVYTNSLTIGPSDYTYDAELTGSSQTWSPEIGIDITLDAGESLVGFAFQIAQNDCPGGNDPAGNIARVRGLTETPPHSYMLYDSGDTYASSLSALYDTYLPAGATNGYLTTEEVIGHYRRAGVSGGPGSIYVEVSSIRFLVKLGGA